MSSTKNDDSGNLPREEPALVVLANYIGAVFYPSGIRLSALQQCHASDILSEIYKGCYRTNVRCALSAEDKITFGDHRFQGADTYGEMLPEGFLDVLWKLGARPGERFYDLGSGTGKLVALAWLVGLRATGVEISRSRSEVAWRSFSQLEARVKEDNTLMASFPQVLTGSLDCICGNLFDVDFTDADIVLFSSVMFTRTMVAQMAAIARRMKPGSRIISNHNLDNLGEAGLFPEFFERGEVHVATTWTATSCWLVHEIVERIEEIGLRPQPPPIEGGKVVSTMLQPLGMPRHDGRVHDAGLCPKPPSTERKEATTCQFVSPGECICRLLRACLFFRTEVPFPTSSSVQHC